MPRREKFSEKSLQALSSRNRMWDGVESEGEEEEDSPEQKGFRDVVDFCLGATEQLKKERERESDKYKSTKQFNIRI